MLFFGFFFTSSSSLIAESEETLVYLFILGKGYFIYIFVFITGDVGFMILAFVCFVLGVTGRCSPPPPHSPSYSMQ